MSTERCAANAGSKTRKYVTLRLEYRPRDSTIRSSDGSLTGAVRPSCAMACRIASVRGRGLLRRRNPNMEAHFPGTPWCERLPACGDAPLTGLSTSTAGVSSPLLARLDRASGSLMDLANQL